MDNNRKIIFSLEVPRKILSINVEFDQIKMMAEDVSQL